MNGSSQLHASINVIFLIIVELFVWIMSRSARARFSGLHVDLIGQDRSIIGDGCAQVNLDSEVYSSRHFDCSYEGLVVESIPVAE